MSKNLLDIVNDVLPEIGFPTVSTVVGNTNQTVVLALALANREGRALAKWKDWRILIKRNTITTASSAESYSLPSDFDRFIHNTEWNDSNDERMEGPLSDERWQADVTGLVTVTVNDRFQIRADGNQKRFFIRPVPTSAEQITFFYATDTWCQSKGGQRQSQWTADDDLLLLDPYVYELGLKVRMLRAQRREFQSELAEYLNERNKAYAQDGGMKTYRILGPIEDSLPQGRIPESGFGS